MRTNEKFFIAANVRTNSSCFCDRSTALSRSRQTVGQNEQLPSAAAAAAAETARFYSLVVLGR